MTYGIIFMRLETQGFAPSLYMLQLRSAPSGKLEKKLQPGSLDLGFCSKAQRLSNGKLLDILI